MQTRVWFDSDCGQVWFSDIDQTFAARSLLASVDADNPQMVVARLKNGAANVSRRRYSDYADEAGNGFASVADCVAYLSGEFAKSLSILGSYAYTQSQAEAIWTIAHGLGFCPNVTVVDTAGDQVVLSDVSFVDTNTALVRFGVPMTGTAYLS